MGVIRYFSQNRGSIYSLPHFIYTNIGRTLPTFDQHRILIFGLTGQLRPLSGKNKNFISHQSGVCLRGSNFAQPGGHSRSFSYKSLIFASQILRHSVTISFAVYQLYIAKFPAYRVNFGTKKIAT
ncbi:hypothetical protein BpHYR1_010894 [Brachionus plicatilis]|uniref:Uncharacterized protein n=1 Tax=Brachionus plicatilis TaxID=10195 RepID=A0A3M7QVY8_BRAPC|nr:hypothetical protein BpHYR1_010894 [Brachionus plicatilis]